MGLIFERTAGAASASRRQVKHRSLRPPGSVDAASGGNISRQGKKIYHVPSPLKPCG